MQSDPKDKESEMKKGKDQDTVLPDSDSSVPDLGCETCGVNFSSIKARESHMKGRKHQKKLAQDKFLSKYMKNGTDGSKSDDDGDQDGDEESQLHCDVCDKDFSGHVSFLTHLKGSVHAKYIKKQKLKEQMTDMPEVLDKGKKENSAEDDKDDDEIFQKVFAQCSVCQKEFSGPESFAQHMKSTAHTKKVEVSKKLDSLPAKQSDGTINSDGEDRCFDKCEVCKKAFSGFIPYHIHMKSSVHKKNVEKKKIAEEMKQFCGKYDEETGFVCKECKKAFLDPVSFKYHLANNSHKKQKARSALLEFLNAFPEIVFATPFGEQNAGGESDSDDATQDFYLICKICHVSFSGPESAREHIRSKKHINLKKEKQVMKLLKEQKIDDD